MPLYDRRPFDLTVNGKGYLLARQAQTGGARAWSRRKPTKADFRVPLEDVQAGQQDGEFIVNFDNTPAAGWGEGRRLAGGTGRYAYSRDADGRFPGQVTLGPLYQPINAPGGLTAGTAPPQFWDFPGYTTGVFLGWGRYVLECNVAAPALTLAQDLGLGVAFDQAAGIDGKALLAAHTVTSGAAVNFWRQTASNVFAQAVGANLAFDAFGASQDATGAILYGAQRYSSVTKMQKLASGGSDTAGWASGWAFGATGRVCSWLVPFGYQTYGAFPDGLYGFDEALNSPNVLADLAAYLDGDNGVGTKQWHGALWIPTIRGLFRYDGGAIEDIGPIQGTTLRTDASGREFGYVTSLEGDAEWLYLATFNGTDSYLFAGRESSQGMLWHSLCYFTLAGPFTAMKIVGRGGDNLPRLFMAQQAATNAVVYLDLPVADNPLQDPGYTYRTNASATDTVWYTSAHDAGVPGVTMTLEEVVVEADSLSANETVTLHYSMDGGTTWTQVRNSAAQAVTITTSPTTVYPAADGTRVGVTLQFRAKLDRAAGTATNTPVLRSIKARVIKRYPRAEEFTATFQIADGLEDRNGNPFQDGGKTLLEHLTGLETVTAPFTVTDPLGVDQTVLLDGDVQVQESAQADAEYPVLLATCRFRVVGG